MARLTALAALAGILLAGCGDPEEPKETEDTEDTEPVDMDVDDDGWNAVEHGGQDCDDSDPDVHPGADEHCDGVDEDCDGTRDEEAVDATAWYRDLDGDGWGADVTEVFACEPPSEEYLAQGGDCDDTSAAYHPGAPEDDCTDPADYDCDGATAWADVDEDGWAACVDCDDEDPTAHPEGVEVCDGADDDCDGAVDEDATDAPTWYADADGDGFGDEDVTTAACEAPEGHVAEAGDCDDGDDATWPGATEYCDEADRDCDGDPTDGAEDATSWYADADGDGYGAGSATDACEQPSGYVDDDTDCNDAVKEMYPGATEDCDLLDNDCDGTIDEDCPEDCEDGWDNDGDGDVDCDDEDCWTDCPEAECDDGTDNDADGLVDCEDGDCAGETVCDEDCTDTVDNDYDGLTDCEDDECWGTSDCPNGIRSRVSEADSMRLVSQVSSSYWRSCYGWMSSWNNNRLNGKVYSVEGVVQVLADASSTWGTATTWMSCGWEASSVRLGVASVTRRGFYVSSGCGLSTSGFLPSQLLISGSQVMVDGASSTLWYGGVLSTSSANLRGYHYSYPCPGGGLGVFGYAYGSLTWTVDPVSSGGTYYFEAD